MRGRELAFAELNLSSAFEIADMIAGGSMEDPQIGKASKKLRAKLDSKTSKPRKAAEEAKWRKSPKGLSPWRRFSSSKL